MSEKERKSERRRWTLYRTVHPDWAGEWRVLDEHADRQSIEGFARDVHGATIEWAEVEETSS